MKIVYTQQARQDIHSIYEYVAFSLCAPESAKSIYQDIIDEVDSLEFMPDRYPIYLEEPWFSLKVRYFSVRKYLVFYKVNPDHEHVTILRVVYGGMDLREQLKDMDELD